MRAFFLLIIASFFIAVSPPTALAAEPKIDPAFNPICWQEKDCACARAKFLRLDCKNPQDPALQGGFVRGAAPCDATGWGKCLPVGKTVTEISFGGKREFANVAVFIQLLYRYAIGVAAIIAVAMIMVAGAQWITSAGNSEAIASAKKRIGGALMGLFLAYLSFFILNALNPALVNFRLPQVFMARPSHAVPQFCSTVSSTGQFEFAASKDNQTVKPSLSAQASFSLAYADPAARDKFVCGNRLFIKNGGEQTCFGDVCNPGAMCIDLDDLGKTAPFHCSSVSIIGRITNDKFTDSGCLAATAGHLLSGEGWESPLIVSHCKVCSNKPWVICKNGTKVKISDARGELYEMEDQQSYYFSLSGLMIDNAAKQCGNQGAKGIVINFEMNEDCDMTNENHWIGYDGEAGANQNRGKDLGDDRFFEKNSATMPEKYFIPLDKVKKGIILNVFAASDIHDIDCPGVFDSKECDAVRAKFYSDLLRN